MSDTLNRPTMADIDNDVILAAIRANKHFGALSIGIQLIDFFPEKLVLAKVQKMVDAGILDCGSVQSAWIRDDVAQPPCSGCRTTDDTWVVMDPYIAELYEKIHLLSFCRSCYRQRAQDI